MKSKIVAKIDNKKVKVSLKGTSIYMAYGIAGIISDISEKSDVPTDEILDIVKLILLENKKGN